MHHLTLQCPSVTYAQKGRRLLEQAGLRCRLTHRSLFGCSYGLELSTPDPGATLALLSDGGVPFTVVKES